MSPGELDRARAELGYATQALASARILLDAGNLEDAVSRGYYAIFHAARAALTIRGLHAKTHSGQIDLFTKTFGEASILGELFDVRLVADYGPGERFTLTADGLACLLERAEQFLQRCEEICHEAAERGPDEPDPPPDV